MKSNNSIAWRLYKLEYYKYREKGIINSLVGLILLLGYICFSPKIFHKFYNFLEYYFSGNFLLTYGNYMLSMLVFWLANGLLFVFYYQRYDIIEKFKITKAQWPWIQDKDYWKKLLFSSIKVLFVNQILINSVLVTFQFLLLTKPIVNVDSFYIPSISEFAFQLFVCLLLYDLFFHLSHRLIHINQYLYKTVHSIHHEYNSPIGISAVYAHPLEYIIANVLPGAIGPLVLGGNMHIVTLFGWTVWGLLSTIEQHSGYDFPFLPFNILPLMFGAKYHEFHHNRYAYNYSSTFTYLDCIFNTNLTYLEYLDKNAKKNKNKD